MDDLISSAHAMARYARLSDECVAGEVGCVLVTGAGNEYRGVSISAACGIGFCAEHAAIAAMITAGESRIAKIVAVNGDGLVLPPCGRCRELIAQINRANFDTRVILGPDKMLTLRELLPHPWQALWE